MCVTSFDGFYFLCLTAEIILLENQVVVYKFVQDLHFFVTGGDEENELILSSVLQAFFESVNLLLRLFSDTSLVDCLSMSDVQRCFCQYELGCP
jgi:hypothetical protein